MKKITVAGENTFGGHYAQVGRQELVFVCQKTISRAFQALFFFIL
jgi:hypothetical protein